MFILVKGMLRIDHRIIWAEGREAGKQKLWDNKLFNYHYYMIIEGCLMCRNILTYKIYSKEIITLC